MPTSEDATPSPLVRRRRMRHEWSEASNPHDLLAARAGWGTAAMILLVMAWLVAINAGWI